MLFNSFDGSSILFILIFPSYMMYNLYTYSIPNT